MNHFRNRTDLTEAIFRALEDIPFPSLDADRPVEMLKKCPRASETPLVMSSDLADRCAVNEVWVKDERDRMGLGSFKALGAAYVIARDSEAGLASERTYVTASAGNHGLSLAAGASAFGSRAVIYLADTVPPSFAERLRSLGAEVKRAGSTYELSMEAAARDAERNGWTLLSDSSWKGYIDRPWVLMEGYLTLAREIVDQMDVVPTHVFLQAGVGGLAASAAAYLRRAWGEAPRIVVVEPEVAPALFASMLAGAPKVSGGPVSDMGRLD